MCHTRIANKWNITIQTSVLWIFRIHHSDAPWNQEEYSMRVLLPSAPSHHEKLWDKEGGWSQTLQPCNTTWHQPWPWQFQGLFSYQHSHLLSLLELFIVQLGKLQLLETLCACWRPIPFPGLIQPLKQHQTDWPRTGRASNSQCWGSTN